MSNAESEALHPLDLATRLERGADGLTGTIDEPYWNMIGPFGGLINAIVLRGVLEDPLRQGSPVALTVNFCGAIARGAFTLRCTPVRTGRITQHWSVELAQEGRVVTTASIVCAVRKPSFRFMPARPPHVPAPEALAPLPQFPGS